MNTLTIALGNTTLKDLIVGKYQLYGLKAVQDNQGGGFPLVWFRLLPSSFTPKINLSYETSYSVFTSGSALSPGQRVMVSCQQVITMGQTADIGTGGSITVSRSGAADAIAASNFTTIQYTWGLALPFNQAADAAPICAFPLYGKAHATIVPVEKVLVVFSTSQIVPGTALQFLRQGGAPQDSNTLGLLVDFTNQATIQVEFDINTGWSPRSGPAQQVPADSDLVKLLVEPQDGGTACRRS
jgi:hypothetical protein